jgi:hypothetical protein
MARRKYRTVEHRVHSRKIDRTVAKNNMKILGINLHNVIKRGRFSELWREYSQDVKTANA